MKAQRYINTAAKRVLGLGLALVALTGCGTAAHQGTLAKQPSAPSKVHTSATVPAPPSSGSWASYWNEAQLAHLRSTFTGPAELLPCYEKFVVSRYAPISVDELSPAETDALAAALGAECVLPTVSTTWR